MQPVLIEGVTTAEIVGLPCDDLRALIFTERPVVFKIGSATVLAEFAVKGSTLSIELAHIDGGGEGVLLVIIATAQKIARRQKLRSIEWLVYATNCARPNLKLRRVLERRGIQVTIRPEKGECYFLGQRVQVEAAP